MPSSPGVVAAGLMVAEAASYQAEHAVNGHAEE